MFSGPGSSTCTACTAGFRTHGGTDDKTHTSCIPCDVGHRCDGTNAMVACTKGYYSKLKSAVCTPCGSVEKYSSTDKAESCLTCPVGYFTSGGESTSTRTTCAVCPKGSTCGSSGKPSRCTAGTYESDGNCVSCGDDKKYSDAGASICDTCPIGMFTSGGSTDGLTRTDCTVCLAGMFCKDGSSSTESCLVKAMPAKAMLGQQGLEFHICQASNGCLCGTMWL